MNTDSFGERELENGLPPKDILRSNLGDHVNPADVPTFGCIVHVRAETDGGVRIRVANLAGLQRTAPTEREALQKIVPAFKQRVAELIEQQAPIPWIDPPSPAEAGEQQRFIPVHL